MSKAPKDIIRAERERRGFKTMKDAADDLKMGVSRYRHYENGTRLPPLEAAGIFQKRWGLDASELCPDAAMKLGMKSSTIGTQAKGDLAVGVWSDIEVVERQTGADGRDIHADISGTARQKQSYRVNDNSINKVFKKGWYAIVDPVSNGSPLEYQDGSLVVVERYRNNMVERSIRRVERQTGKMCELACYSTDKRYAGERIKFPTTNGDEVVIIGLVVGGSFDV
jgi:transcriptional regulator with XRE-family HTH domain